MYLGIEIGGTKLQLGVGAGDGVLAGLWRGAVDVAAGPEGIRRQIADAVPELRAASASASAVPWMIRRRRSSNRTRSRAGTASRWRTGSAIWSACRRRWATT